MLLSQLPAKALQLTQQPENSAAVLLSKLKQLPTDGRLYRFYAAFYCCCDIVSVVYCKVITVCFARPEVLCGA